MDMFNDLSEPRLQLADEPKPLTLEDDPAPIKRMRYIFTIAMPAVDLPDNPLVQKTHLAAIVDKINAELKPERVGLIAIMENGHAV